MIFEKIKALRRKIAAHDITWWEVLPLLIALIAPNILQPTWMWRLFSLFIASVGMIVVCLHGLLAPEQVLQKRYDQSVKYKKPLFWFLYVMGIFLIPIIFIIGFIPSTNDLYRTIKDSDQALEKKVIEIVKSEGGGSVSPWFIDQTLYNAENEIYHLPFSFRGIRRGTYYMIYSPHTNIVYEIVPIK